MATKFFNALTQSNSKLKEERAKAILNKANGACIDIERELTKEIQGIEEHILDLTDLGPDSKESLRPTNSSFKAEDWVRELYQAKVELTLKNEELRIFNEMKAEWFTDEEN